VPAEVEIGLVGGGDVEGALVKTPQEWRDDQFPELKATGKPGDDSK
jgi:hypothetical protein